MMIVFYFHCQNNGSTKIGLIRCVFDIGWKKKVLIMVKEKKKKVKKVSSFYLAFLSTRV